MIELTLIEEVIETADGYFKGVEERIKELKVTDRRMKLKTPQLRTLLEGLRERKFKAMSSLVSERPPRSRKLKTREATTQKVKKEMAKKGHSA
jgi:hypothetical protein